MIDDARNGAEETYLSSESAMRSYKVQSVQTVADRLRRRDCAMAEQAAAEIVLSKIMLFSGVQVPGMNLHNYDHILEHQDFIRITHYRN